MARKQVEANAGFGGKAARQNVKISGPSRQGRLVKRPSYQDVRLPGLAVSGRDYRGGLF